jgi:ubiquinone biosynthesis protein UbiJ
MQKRQALEQQARATEWEISLLTEELSTSRASLEAITVAQGAAAAEVLRLKEQVEPLEARVKTLSESTKDLLDTALHEVMMRQERC